MHRNCIQPALLIACCHRFITLFQLLHLGNCFFQFVEDTSIHQADIPL